MKDIQKRIDELKQFRSNYIKYVPILEKIKMIHESNKHLRMSDVSNEEIIEALEAGVRAIAYLIYQNDKYMEDLKEKLCRMDDDLK